MKIYAIKGMLYKGQKTFDQNGKLTSESQTIDLPIYGSLEWNNFFKSIRNLGYSSLDVIKTNEVTYEDNKPTYKEVDTPKEIISEIENSFNPVIHVELTPEQKQIAELKAMVEKLSNDSKPKVKPAKDEDLEAARQEYLEVLGKKPHHLLSLEKINAEIAEAKN